MKRRSCTLGWREERGSVTRLMDTQYRISYRLYWIDYKRNVLNYQSSTSLLSTVAMFPVGCN